MTLPKLPPLLGSDNRKWLAAIFASRDLTIGGVPDSFERRRLRARIAYQERWVAMHRREICIDHGSTDGTLDGVPADRREAAYWAIANEHADVQAECRADLKRPSLLRARRDELLNPFHGEPES